MLGLGLGLGQKTRQMQNTLPALQSFEIETFIAAGASLTHESFLHLINRQLCEAIALQLYGKNVSVYDRARSGDDVDAQEGYLPLVFSEFSGDPHVVFANHIGGNNMTYGTEFLNLSPTEQSQHVNDYNKMITDFENTGQIVIPFGLTFRNVGGSVLDPDPSTPKSNELAGSYTYNRDWIQPIITTRLPTHIRNNRLAFSLYDYTRSIHDIYLDADNIHPTTIGEILHSIQMFMSVMEASEGRYISAPVEVNFNNSFPSPATPLDVIVATHTDNPAIVPSNPNINWVAVPEGSSSAYSLLAENLHQTDGTPADGVKIIYAGIEKSFVGASESGNTSATLDNSMLRNSYIGLTGDGGVIAALILGLEPNCTYEISACSMRRVGYRTRANTFSESSPDGNAVVTISTRADPYGRIVVRKCEFNASYDVSFSAIRIRSI